MHYLWSCQLLMSWFSVGALPTGNDIFWSIKCMELTHCTGYHLIALADADSYATIDKAVALCVHVLVVLVSLNTLPLSISYDSH